MAACDCDKANHSHNNALAETSSQHSLPARAGTTMVENAGVADPAGDGRREDDGPFSSQRAFSNEANAASAGSASLTRKKASFNAVLSH
jgi:hypothetical protein